MDRQEIFKISDKITRRFRDLAVSIFGAFFSKNFVNFDWKSDVQELSKKIINSSLKVKSL